MNDLNQNLKNDVFLESYFDMTVPVDAHIKSILLFLMVLSYVCKTTAQQPIPDPPPQIVLASVLDSTAEHDTPCLQACVAIASSLPDSVFVGQTGNFDFWDAKQAEVIPACRVEPSSTNVVSRILEVIIEHQCHFAIKSGGHDRTAGASNADGGITIDLVRLDDINIAQDGQSVTIGAGLRWDVVYEALERRNLMVLGGRVADVGVGGLLLGGGISFYSNERGLACDSVISYELVLPNASTITVDQSSQPDLYKALRGAGATNFGIVTSFELEAFPLDNADGIWTGQKLYPWEEVGDLLQANYDTVTQAMDADPSVAIMNIISCSPAHMLCYGAVQAQHTSHTSDQQWPESLKMYDDIRGLKQTVNVYISPSSNVTRRLSGTPSMRKHRTIYGTFTYIPSIELESRILEIFWKQVDSVSDMTGFSPGIIMHPLSRTMIAKMRNNGGNSLRSVVTHKGALIIFNVSWQWYQSMDDDRAYRAYHQLMAEAEQCAKQLGVWHPYKYINYAESTQDVWAGYGEDSFKQLKSLQRKIDPTGIFTEGGLASGFFKLNEYSPKDPAASAGTWEKSEL